MKTPEIKIHESHKMQRSRQFEGLNTCAFCGATSVTLNATLLAAPCSGKAPSLKVLADENVIAIQWSFPEGGVHTSTFPQPLVTVDQALDGRPIQVVFVGPRATELRQALQGDLIEQRDEAIRLLANATDPENSGDWDEAREAGWEWVRHRDPLSGGEAA